MTDILYCDKCPLGIFNNFHPTNGDGQGDIMIIGESPTGTDVKKGKPFAGKSGKLVRKILQKYNLTQHCYFTTVIKCKTPYNRTARPTEISACKSYLYSEIFYHKPKIIILLGTVAMQWAYPNKVIISVNTYSFSQRNFGSTVIGIAYHPSYILHNPNLLPEYSNFFNNVSTLYAHLNPYYNRPQR